MIKPLQYFFYCNRTFQTDWYWSLIIISDKDQAECWTLGSFKEELLRVICYIRYIYAMCSPRSWSKLHVNVKRDSGSRDWVVVVKLKRVICICITEIDTIMSIYLPKYCISLALIPTLTDKERKVYGYDHRHQGYICYDLITRLITLTNRRDYIRLYLMFGIV